jgi:hypothetical protein
MEATMDTAALAAQEAAARDRQLAAALHLASRATWALAGLARGRGRSRAEALAREASDLLERAALAVAGPELPALPAGALTRALDALMQEADQ